MIDRVVKLLFLNAMRYGAGKDVTINLYNDDKMIYLKVTDQGEPLDSNCHPDGYYRTSRMMSSLEVDSLNLEMKLAQTIVNEHGGEMKISLTEVGNEFLVSFPILGNK